MIVDGLFQRLLAFINVAAKKKQSEKHMEEQRASKTFQIIAAITANIGAFALGNGLAWSSPALPKISDCGLECDPDVGDIGEEAGSWVAGLFAIGAMVSGPATGFFMDRIGRRSTMILMAVPSIVGWICLIMPKFVHGSTGLFYVGRLLTGFGLGAFSLACPRYTSEIGEIGLRGALGSMMQFMLTIGLMFNNGLNIKEAVSWETITGLCILFPALMAIGMSFMPESPYYLITKGRESEAKDALRKFRGSHYKIEKELEEIKLQHEQLRQSGSISFRELLTTDIYVKPFVIIVALMFFQQYSGINAVSFYLVDIFRDAGSKMDPGLSAFIVTVVQVLSTGLAMVLVDRFGRRILLILSDALMAVSILSLGVYFYLKENIQCPKHFEAADFPDCKLSDGFDPDLIAKLSFLPLVSLIVYILAFSIGFGPLPWAINSELFPQEAKNLSSSIATSVNWLCAFLVSKFMPNIEKGFHTSGAYWMYAVVCAVGTVFVIFFLPETKGKTPDEMKEYFRSDKYSVKEGQTNDGFEAEEKV